MAIANVCANGHCRRCNEYDRRDRERRPSITKLWRIEPTLKQNDVSYVQKAVVHYPIFKERRKRLVKGEQRERMVNSPNCLLKSNIQPRKAQNIRRGNAENEEGKRVENRRTCMVAGIEKYLVVMVLQLL